MTLVSVKLIVFKKEFISELRNLFALFSDLLTSRIRNRFYIFLNKYRLTFFCGFCLMRVSFCYDFFIIDIQFYRK